MGWANGTDIFDAVAEKVLDLPVSDPDKYDVIRALANALRDGDWDTLDESNYIDDPIVAKVFVDIGWIEA